MTNSIVRLDLDVAGLLAKYDSSGKLPPYFDVLREENQKVNLVSRETIAGGLETLAAESLFPFEKIERDSFASYLDIGSGGGFPAIPLILTRNIQKARLVERTSKKSLALERIIKGLGLDNQGISVERSDFEQLLFPDDFDLITMRLVKLTSRILRKVHSVLRVDGHFVYYSVVPENISTSHFTCLSYCYRVKSDSTEKYFTIFQKN